MNSVASNYLSLKYQKSTTSGSIDIGIRKFEFVAKNQFLLGHSIRRLSKIHTLIILYIDERRMDFPSQSLNDVIFNFFTLFLSIRSKFISLEMQV